MSNLASTVLSGRPLHRLGRRGWSGVQGSNLARATGISRPVATGFLTPGEWTQEGSNLRPSACRAAALPLRHASRVVGEDSETPRTGFQPVALPSELSNRAGRAQPRPHGTHTSNGFLDVPPFLPMEPTARLELALSRLQGECPSRGASSAWCGKQESNPRRLGGSEVPGRSVITAWCGRRALNPRPRHGKPRS